MSDVGPRFIVKAIIKDPGGFMVTYPDYFRERDTPFSVRDATRIMEADEVLEWLRERLLQMGGAPGRVVEVEARKPEVEKTRHGNPVRSQARWKKLKCGHRMPRAGHRGVYPTRCAVCEERFEAKVKLLRRKGRVL